MQFSLTTQKVRVSLSGTGTAHTPVPSVPTNHSAFLAEAVVTQVGPHPEQVQLHFSELCSQGPVSGTTAQPQGAGGGDGLSDDGPLGHHFTINLEHLHTPCVTHMAGKENDH